MVTPPDETTAAPYTVIATLRAEREALKAENEELRAAQAAGLEVLQTMVASPGDRQPVFDLIARQAADLCAHRRQQLRCLMTPHCVLPPNMDTLRIRRRVCPSIPAACWA
jgi:hypothetical protein